MTAAISAAGRLVDHVVVPVGSLGEARQLFAALGFTVAADTVHPFGTGNACVFLADGTYLEPLAVLDRDLAEMEAAGGNAFLRRDLGYRLRHGLPGLSGVALKSADAFADRLAFAAAGYDGGDILEFGRVFEAPDGARIDMSFRLAFAADRAAPGTFVFACQRLFDSVPDRGTLSAHANGATRLLRLVYAAAEPDRERAFVEKTFGGRDIVANSLGFSLAIGNAAVDVLAFDGLAARYGVKGAEEGGLHLAGLVFETADRGAARRFAGGAGHGVTELLGRLVVPVSETGSVFIAFEPTGR